MIKHLVSTRHGFFAFAAVVSWLTLLVIEPEFRWVSLATGGLYAALSLMFFLEHVTRRRSPPRDDAQRGLRTHPDSQ